MGLLPFPVLVLLATALACAACGGGQGTASPDAGIDADVAQSEPAADAPADPADPGDEAPDPGPDVVDDADGAEAEPDVFDPGPPDPPADPVTDDSSADPGQPPVSCAAISSNPAWSLCVQTPSTCEAVFTDHAGCVAVCQAAGLACLRVFENVDGQCAKDEARPELTCDPASGHGSDYCVCGLPGSCSGGCGSNVCGPDGCGGNCGTCVPGMQCVSGACQPTGPVEDCTKYPFKAETLLAELVGFGQGTTGGDPSKVFHVTSTADSGAGTLREALESQESWWIVFDVEGEFAFDFDDDVKIRSNKTVDGRGRDVRIRDAQFKIDPGVGNVIFSDVEAFFHDPQDNVGDVFGLRGHGGDTPDAYDTRRFWFHHLDLHHGGDGLIDIRGGTEITISWGHFHDHTKVMLHTLDTDSNPSPGTRITYHHNWFDTVTRRGPHFAYGLADYFNNWQYHWYEYGAASIDEARFLSEANIYEAREGLVCIIPCPDPSPHGGGNDFVVSKVGLSIDWAQDKTHGFSRSVGDWLLNGAQVNENEPGKVFQRSDYYVAVPEKADEALRSRIQSEAGPRRTYCK